MIEIKKATVYRGDNRVLTDLSLEIAKGCHTAILGPNGAGKSTLLKLLSGEILAVDRDGSSVALFGLDRWNVWELRTRLGIVSHDLHHDYLDDARGADVILSGYYASIGTYGHQHFTVEQRELADRIMATLGIAALKERMFSRMSTGEQRRCLLGRALVHDPDLLVFDEPTSGLDLRACFQYLEVVRNLMRQGKTIILVTHHIHEIPPEISRVILLKSGRVIDDGKKTAMLTSERLTDLFDTPVELVCANGWYQAIPAQGKSPSPSIIMKGSDSEEMDEFHNF